jgi:hypothetical protein
MSKNANYIYPPFVMSYGINTGEGALCKAFPPWGKRERGLFEKNEVPEDYHFNILFLTAE